MTSTPWSVKGIDSKARETAKELARRSGMTLGEWLNERIREEGGAVVEESASAVTRALNELTGRIETAEQRSTLTLAGVDQTVKGMVARLELTEREAVAVGARFEGALQEQQAIQAAIDARLRKLESEAAGPRSAEALKSLETALGRVANHLYEGEGRTRDSIADLRRDMGNLTARVERAEANAGQSGVEGDVAALVARLDKAEARAAERLCALETSVSQLTRRLAAAEGKLEQPVSAAEVDKKLQDMAAQVARALQAARSEMTKQLKEVMDGGADRFDQAVMDLSAHVQSAEKRSAEALEKMGQEVLRVADVLNRRVQGVETRAAGAISNMGAEVARVVDTLDARIDRADQAQAEGITKIGEEIARVTERLSDRIGVAERRAAQAVDDVQDKLALAAERLNQRHDRAQGDLAERIRLSEERTQRLLEEARERLDRRLAESAKAATPAPVIAPPPIPPTVSTASPYAEPPSFAADTLSAPAFPSAQPEASGASSRAIYPDAAPFGFTYAPKGFTPVEPEFDEEDIEAAQDLGAPVKAETEADFVEEEFRAEDLDDEPLIAAPALDEPEEEVLIAEVDEDEPAPIAAAPAPADMVDDAALLEPAPLAAPPAPAAPSIAPRILTTKELVEQARAAARAASVEQKSKKAKPKKAAAPADDDASVIGPIGFNASKRKDSGARAAMYMALAGAAVVIGGSSYVLFATDAGEELVNAWKSETPGEPTAPRAAVALDPKPIVDAPPAPVVSGAAVDPQASGWYEEGMAKLRAKDNSGVDLITRAANLGHPKAQYERAQLYANGTYGVAKNQIEARRWYERAAKGGDAQAMHNAAGMHYQGIGGPKNLVSAAEWYKRAAEAGLPDSQYNIGQMYEFPHPGVPQNAAEAYKWYLLAAKGGTPEQKAQARAAADRVKVTLPAAARAAAERIASDFIARSSGAPVQITTGAVNLLQVQTALARLDYYRGPIDGKSSEGLRTAIQDFQRDRGLAQNGEVDTVTAMKLNPFIVQ